MPYLKEDVLSNYHHKGQPIVYGRKGDKVKEISRSDVVLIVEDVKGERWPCHRDKIIETEKTNIK